MTDVAARSAPSPFTPEEEARIREIVIEATTIDPAAIADRIGRELAQVRAQGRRSQQAGVERLPHHAE